MKYEENLGFLRNLLKKCRLQSLELDPEQIITSDIYLGLNWLVSEQENERRTAADYLPDLEENKVYRFKDPFLCEYIFLLLPQRANKRIFCIGPYLSKSLSYEEILEIAEKYKMDNRQATHLESYYDGVPLVTEDSFILAAIETFAECIWGKNENFQVVDVNSNYDTQIADTSFNAITGNEESIFVNMKIMENRYAYENELIDAVKNGQVHKADLIFSGFSNITIEARLADPVRNLKNYCVIMNTLLRKAAESGGVHPLYLDSISTDFAMRIERAGNLQSARNLMPEMFISYCNLVRKHSLKNYSPPVQKAILCIESDLSANLSLNSIAQMQNLSSGYLSGLFKKETGKTITTFIAEKRVEQAKHLLSTTNLQVQTVAQYCGIYDVHYFSKVFRKYTGLTPKAFREKR